MPRRVPGPPASAPLEATIRQFDGCFASLAQRRAFRDYLHGLLLPRERNKTLAGLAGTEPVGLPRRYGSFALSVQQDREYGYGTQEWAKVASGQAESGIVRSLFPTLCTLLANCTAFAEEPWFRIKASA